MLLAQRIRGFLNDMRYINPRFTYLLTAKHFSVNTLNVVLYQCTKILFTHSISNNEESTLCTVNVLFTCSLAVVIVTA